MRKYYHPESIVEIQSNVNQTYVVCWLPEKFEHMKKTGDYYVVVVEDTNLGQIVATATLITEHKFIHSCAKVNYIPARNLCPFTTLYCCDSRKTYQHRIVTSKVYCYNKMFSPYDLQMYQIATAIFSSYDIVIT